MKNLQEPTQPDLPDSLPLLAGLSYFGTALNYAGHFFWMLHGDRMDQSRTYFSDIPFDPEHIISHCQNGTVKYLRVEDYSICAIEGSCYDKRPGSHSIFWTKEPVRLGDMKAIILSIPIAKKIIEQMPFEVAW